MTAPLPPRSGSPAMVPVNTRPLSVSSISAPGTFTFRNNSAGLGVPRDFGELKSVSSDVAHHGQVNTEVERSVIGPSAAFANHHENGNREANGNLANGTRGANGHEYTPGSRSVGTFTRTDMRANGANGMEGWNNPNNGLNNGMNGGAPNNGAVQGSSAAAASPRGTWQRPDGGGSGGSPMPRSMGESRTNAAPPSSGGGSSQGGAPASHK